MIPVFIDSTNATHKSKRKNDMHTSMKMAAAAALATAFTFAPMPVANAICVPYGWRYLFLRPTVPSSERKAAYLPFPMLVSRCRVFGVGFTCCLASPAWLPVAPIPAIAPPFSSSPW